MKKGRIVLVIIILILAGLGVYRFLLGRRQPPQEDHRPVVELTQPALRDITIYTQQIGTVEPAQTVSVYPKISGEVLEVHFSQGERVTEGQVLATLNSDALTSLRIQVDTARAAVGDANTALERMEALAAAGAVSPQALEQAQSQAKSAGFAYASAQNQYDLQEKYSRITAPIGGVVETKAVDPHSMVAPGTPIAVISGDEGVQVKFGASQDVQKHLAPGDTLTVSRGDAKYQGVVTEVGNTVSPTTGLYEVKAALPQGGDLASGVKVKLDLIKAQEKGVLTVPLSAVLYAGTKAYVYTYAQGSLQKKSVVTGLYDGEYISITEGLNASDTVVYTWSGEVYDGASVLTPTEGASQEEGSASGEASQGTKEPASQSGE